MSSPKPLPKVPEKVFKVNGKDCTEREFRRYHDELRALKEKESQLWRVVASQMRPFRRY